MVARTRDMLFPSTTSQDSTKRRENLMSLANTIASPSRSQPPPIPKLLSSRQTFLLDFSQFYLLYPRLAA